MIKKMMLVLTVSLIIVVFAGLIITLINNQANLLRPPGFKQRLAVFFNQNTAATADEHPFPELTTPVYTLPPRQLFRVVLGSARKLGWHLVSADAENLKAEFEVTTPVFGFVDDVMVQVIFVDMNTGKLYIRSASRKGKADLAANSGHIQSLLERVRSDLGR